MSGTIAESDVLDGNYRRIDQTERKHDCNQSMNDEKNQSSRQEPFDDDYPEAFGWRKHPNRIREVWEAERRIYKHVRVHHDADDNPKSYQQTHLMMAVDHEDDGLLAIRLKQIGVHIKEDQVGWKLERGTAVRVGREEDVAKLGNGCGAHQPILLRGTLGSDWEGTEWIAELKLEKISDKDYYLMMVGTVPFGSFNVDHRMKAEDVGHWWFYDGRHHRKPKPSPEPIAKAKAEEAGLKTTVYKPKRDNGNRISKPASKSSTVRTGHTVSRLASSMGQKVTLSRPTATRKPAAARATPGTSKACRMEPIPGNDGSTSMHKHSGILAATEASSSMSGQPASDGPQQASTGTFRQGLAYYGSSLLSGLKCRGKSKDT